MILWLLRTDTCGKDIIIHIEVEKSFYIPGRSANSMFCDMISSVMKMPNFIIILGIINEFPKFEFFATLFLKSYNLLKLEPN